MMWTVIATGEHHDPDSVFYFDLEIYNPDNPMKRITIRFVLQTNREDFDS